jgi:hypothetical protein
MAIEIIPRPKVELPVWVIIIFVACAVLILGLGGSYFYFEQGSRKLTRQIEEKEMAIVKTPEEIILEESVLSKERKINAFAGLLSGHNKVANVFAFLESVCHPQVWFSDFNFSSGQNSVTVKGKAASFVVLGQQISILKNEQILKNVTLSDLSMSEEGGITFSIQLTLDPQIYKQ